MSHLDELALKVAGFADLAPAHKILVSELDTHHNGITAGYAGLTDEDGARSYLFAFDRAEPVTVLEVEFPADPDEPVVVLGLHAEHGGGWHVETTFKPHN